MVKSKKLLSIFLAVVMVLSVFTVMASAYTRGEAEGAADIDLKYTVEKVDTIPATEAGSAEWSADNMYAVTVWMKASKPVDILTAPVHYNKALFAPITLSDGDCTYPYGAGLDQDTYYSDMGEGAVYAYSLGDYMNNTGMYKANGTTATTKALAKCIGLGNSNSDGVGVITELVSPDHPLYSKWGAGLSADTGVVYFNLNVATKTKTAYLNTINGIETSTDWNRMFTLYFESITDADVTGAEFGVYTDDCFTVDGNYDATGSSYYAGASSYKAEVPSMNVVSNAVVEEAAAPVLEISQYKDQIRYNDGNFDYRTVYKIDNFGEIFADLNDGSDRIIDAGFIFSTEEAIDVDAAKTQVESWKSTADGKNITFDVMNYSAATRCYVSTSFEQGQYVFTCLVKGIDNAVGEKTGEYEGKETNLSALGYIIYKDAEGNTAYAYYDYTLDVDALYNQYK